MAQLSKFLEMFVLGSVRNLSKSSSIAMGSSYLADSEVSYFGRKILEQLWLPYCDPQLDQERGEGEYHPVCI